MAVPVAVAMMESSGGTIHGRPGMENKGGPDRAIVKKRVAVGGKNRAKPLEISPRVCSDRGYC